jgi:hypothetical protein
VNDLCIAIRMRSTAPDEHSVRENLGSRRKVDSSAVGRASAKGNYRISFRVCTASWPMASFLRLQNRRKRCRFIPASTGLIHSATNFHFGKIEERRDRIV